jgi:hypothetical protein
VQQGFFNAARRRSLDLTAGTAALRVGNHRKCFLKVRRRRRKPQWPRFKMPPISNACARLRSEAMPIRLREYNHVVLLFGRMSTSQELQ